ncbi:MAG TPA: protein kinase [Chlamydiales bacterium]|nr:protein kinase [Chlamydiales bacterium]
MSKRNYTVITDQTIHWVWKYRPSLFSRLLLHRKMACTLSEAPPEIINTALRINVLAFIVLLINYKIGAIPLTDTALVIPTHLILGRGSSSLITVALLFENHGTSASSVRRVAFRRPFFDEDNKSGYIPKAYRTNETQKSLYDHPNIEPNALYLGEIEDPKHPYPLEFTVEEIWEQGYSYNIKHKTERQAVDTLEIILGMAKALEYLHSYNLIHRDIKPWNVLVRRLDDGHLDVKVTDVETIRPATERKIPMRGTPGFIAPEVEASFERISGTQHAVQSKAADMYALGQSILYFRFILLQRAFERARKYQARMHDMIHAKMRTTVDRSPLSKKSFKSLMARLAKNGAFDSYEYLELILNTLEDLARQLTNKDPQKRPTASEVIDLLQSLADVTDFKPFKQME